MEESNINTQHEDIIHDVAYDYYGKRMATCSSDQSIKIFDQDEKGNWISSFSIQKAHSGSVWKVVWAHPEFGQVIASCSFDRTVCIWEEDEGKKWKKRATLVDSRDSVQDIKFAPYHLGLKIAAGSSDGFVRIYEAIDLANLEQWPPMEEFEAHKEKGVTCLSWSPSSDKLMIITGGGTEMKLWEYNHTNRKWMQIQLENFISSNLSFPSIRDVSWAPNLGRTFHLIAIACKDDLIILKINFSEKKLIKSDLKKDAWRVEWNVTGTILASSGDDGAVSLWKLHFDDTWKTLAVIEGTDEDSKTG